MEGIGTRTFWTFATYMTNRYFPPHWMIEDLQARLPELIGSYPFAVYMLFSLCRITGETALDSPETSGATFFPRTRLPELSTYRVGPEQLQRVFRVCDDQALPAEID